MPLTQYVRGRETGPSDVFIATPSASGMPHANYVASLANTLMSLGKLGMAADYCLHSGDCHVDDARNSLVRQFMMSECPVMLFIDDDVGWRTEDFVRIVKADRDLVAGVYPLKQDEVDFPVRVPDNTALYADKDGLVEVDGAPTGFMAIRRNVIERFIEKNKKRQFFARGVSKDDIPHTLIFERTLVKGHRWSGDYNFCREWREMGGKVYVDPEMQFTHEGSKQWTGTLGDFWRQKHDVMDPRLDAAFMALQSGDLSDQVFGEIFLRWNNHYSAGPGLAMAAYNAARETRGPILEVGSGLTTIVMGMAAAMSGAEIYTLEHDLGWFLKIEAMIKRYGLTSVRLHYAPLERRGRLTWYSIPKELPERFSLVLCDGPPRRYGRYGLFELLGERIVSADWLVDDADDENQVAMLKLCGPEREMKIIGKDGLRKFAYMPAIQVAASSAA